MSFLQCNSYDFDQDQALFQAKALTSRQPDLGPWVSKPLQAQSKKKVKNLQQKPKRQVNTADFLSNIKNKGHKRFFCQCTITKQKSQDMREINNDFDGIINDSNGINNDFLSKKRQQTLQKACYISYPLPEQNFNPKGKKVVKVPKKKVALNTTMYVYSNQKDMRFNALQMNPRGFTANDMSPRKFTAQTNRSQINDHSNYIHHQNLSLPHTPFEQGNRNLQRILKVKQKIRNKKSALVKKLKEKLVHVETELSPTKIKEQIDNLHQKTWVSTTLRRQNQQEFYQVCPKSKFETIQVVRERRNWSKYSRLRQFSFQNKQV